MRLLNDSKESMEFAFEHGKEYQSVQFNFFDAVESLDHNNIIVRKCINRINEFFKKHTHVLQLFWYFFTKILVLQIDY